MKKAFGILVIFFQLFIPFIILVFCYGNITWMLSRRINTDMTDTNVDNNGVSSECQSPTHVSSSGKRKQLADVHKDKFQLARRNTIKTLLIVDCCFIVCWSQNQVLYLMFNLGYNLDWNSGYYHFTVLMVFVNCTVNPFIYLIKYQDFQIALREFIKCQSSSQDEFQSQNSLSSVSALTNSKYWFQVSVNAFEIILYYFLSVRRKAVIHVWSKPT